MSDESIKADPVASTMTPMLTPGSMSAAPQSWATGFFAAWWRGDWGLPRTYWLGGFVVSLGWALLFAVLAETGKTDPTFVRLSLMLAPLWFAYGVLSSVGIWRAADRYTGPTSWAALAKFAVLMGCLRMLGEFFGLFQ